MNKPVINYFKFIDIDQPEFDFGNIIPIEGILNTSLKLTDLEIPYGYQLVGELPYFISTTNPIEIFLRKSTYQQIDNYCQFMVDGLYYGNKEKITGNLGERFDIDPILPKGYQLVDDDLIITLNADHPNHFISIRKESSEQKTININYIQFTFESRDLSEKCKIGGKINSNVDISSLIPAKYQLLENSNSVSIKNEGFIHRIPLIKVDKIYTDPVDNYLTFKNEENEYSIKIKRTGELGDEIDINPWIPKGFKLKNPNCKLYYSKPNTVHQIELIKL